MTENDSGTVELTRRKALGSMAILGAAGAGAGAGSWAWFSSEESSEDNTISAGTVELDVNDSSGFSYSWTGIAPGDEVGEYSLTLENSGSIDTDQLIVETEFSDGDNDEDLAGYIDLELSYTGSATPDDQTLQGIIDDDLDLGGLDAGQSEDLTVSATFNENAGNGLQGASVDVDHTFILRQESGQDG